MIKFSIMKTNYFVVVLLFVLSGLNPLLAQDVKRPAIKGIAHFALYASDFDNTLDFYKNFLGYSEPYNLSFNNDGKVSLSFIKINDRQLVEVFREKNSSDERFFHFGLETDDAEGMRKYLKSKGVDVPDNTPKGRIGNLNYFVTDPNGTICEIVEYGKDGTTVKDRGFHLSADRISGRMSHIGFMVPDLDKALEFYCGILGFKEVWRGSSDGKHTTWVHIQVPEGTDCIELMLYDNELSKSARGVFNHICLEVEDVKSAINVLNSRVLPSGCRHNDFKVGKNRKEQINYFDKDGTRVEIMSAKTIDGVPTPSTNLPPLYFNK